MAITKYTAAKKKSIEEALKGSKETGLKIIKGTATENNLGKLVTTGIVGNGEALTILMTMNEIYKKAVTPAEAAKNLAKLVEEFEGTLSTQAGLLDPEAERLGGEKKYKEALEYATRMGAPAYRKLLETI